MKHFIPLLLLTAFCSITYGFGSLKGRAPGTNEAFVALWLKSMNATVTINDQIAVVYVDQVFANTAASTKEGTFDFTLPEGAVIDELALWINGQRCVGTPVQKTQATSAYDNAVRASVDPAIITDMGNNEYQVNVYPIDAAGDSLSQRRIDFTYVVPLKYYSDTVGFFFPLQTTGLSSQAPLQTTLSIAVTSQDSIVDIQIPNFNSNQIGRTRNSGKSISLMFGATNAYVDQNLTLNIIGAPSWDYRCKSVTYVPGLDTTFSFDSTDKANYFTTWITAPMWTNDSVKPRECVFVVDASMSMAGNKFNELALSLQHALSLLSPGDSFNIITFNTSVKSFAPSLVPATPVNINQASAFLSSAPVKGITDLSDGVKKALAEQWAPGCTHAVFLLSDGYFTWPLRMSSADMSDSINAANTAYVQINTVTTDTGADLTFLSLLSSRSGGTLISLAQPDTQSGQLSEAIEQLMYSMLSDIKLDFGGLDTSDVYPVTLPDLPSGGQLNVTGRYTKIGTYPVVLSGRRSGVAVQETLSTTLPVAGNNNHSLPQLWASTKVDNLLDQIAVQGALPPLVQSIVTLGLKYGIVTPYTSLLVLANQPPASRVLIDKRDRGAILKAQLAVDAAQLSRFVLIRYAVPTSGGVRNVSLKVYDVRGELVKVLVDQASCGGWYMVKWDGKNAHGSSIGTGCYVMVLQIGSERIVQSLRLMR